ncbi:hypothetical protein AAF712_015146 [Marasmius tenuissimus]|uniref:Uncharacterized protein n=1 Tax=Marasmius tenuissimus TaxID=585030 RepID=A0ABR2Z9C8_9AGAR
MPPTTAKETPAVKASVSSKYNLAVPSSVNVKKGIKNYTSKYVPISTTECIRRARVRREQAAKIRSRIAEILRGVRQDCDKLGVKYRRKPQYFLDMVYQGGVRLTKQANEPNNFNAFKCMTAYERHEAGLPLMSTLEIQKDFRPKYDTMTEEEIDDMLIKYKNIKDEDRQEKIKRPSVKEKAEDVAGSLKHVVGILQGLKTRVGVNAITLVVKNRMEDFMGPKWIVTDEQLMEYLGLILRGWDLVVIGQRVEAYAVAGCNISKVCQNPKEYMELLKKTITHCIQDGLDSACKTKNLMMQYERFDHLITGQYGVIIEGWPANLNLQKPGFFHGDTNKLLQLQEAWKSARVQGLADGSIKVKVRAKRKDAGTKRPKKGKKTSQADEKESDKSDEESNKESDDESGVGRLETTGGKRDEVSAPEPTSTKKSASAKKPPARKLAATKAKKTSGSKGSSNNASGEKDSSKTKKSKAKRAGKNKTPEQDGISDASNAQDTNNPSPLPTQEASKPHPLPKRVLPGGGSVQFETGTATITRDGGNSDDAVVECQPEVLGDTLPPSTLVLFISPHGFVNPAISVNSTPVISHDMTTPYPNTFSDSAIDPALQGLTATTEPSKGSPASPHPPEPCVSVVLTACVPSGHSTPVSVPPDLPPTVPDGGPTSKRKRQSEEVETDGGRGKRKRTACVQKHLSASSHPATRARGEASDDEGTSAGQQ